MYSHHSTKVFGLKSLGGLKGLRRKNKESSHLSQDIELEEGGNNQLITEVKGKCSSYYI